MVGLTGFFFANFTAQLLSSNFGGFTGIDPASRDLSWGSSAFTAASFVGILAAQPLERRLGMRSTFAWSALLLAVFGALQATYPSAHTLLAMRAFEGFATGGFGPRSLVATFLRHRAGPVRALIVITFLLLVAGVMGLTMYGASQPEFGWRGLFLVQLGLGVSMFAAGLRWLPTRPEQHPPPRPHRKTAELESSIARPLSLRRRSRRAHVTRCRQAGPGPSTMKCSLCFRDAIAPGRSCRDYGK